MCLVPGSLLLVAAQLEDRRADVRHRHGVVGVGVLSLDPLLVDQLAADPLQLPADLDLPAVQVDARPGEAQHLAAAQAVDEDQHVRGVHRVVAVPSRGEEPAGLLDAPDRAPAAALRRAGHLGQRGGVPGQQFLGVLGVVEGGPQGVAGRLHRAASRVVLAATQAESGTAAGRHQGEWRSHPVHSISGPGRGSGWR